jgi:molybdopterin converting factor subunit 1
MNDLTVRVRFFAGHRAIVGAAEQQRRLTAGSSVGDLWQQLSDEYPALAPYLGRMLIARNQEFCTLESALQEGDEIAFIPPVSGGRARQ